VRLELAGIVASFAIKCSTEIYEACIEDKAVHATPRALGVSYSPHPEYHGMTLRAHGSRESSEYEVADIPLGN
jgi:hypothetical protein